MNTEFLGIEACLPTFSRNVANAWESFMVTGDCAPQAVRNVILQSWQRCRNQNVGQGARQALMAAQSGGLSRLQLRNQDLRMATKQAMASLAAVMDASKSLLMVADAEGVILDVYGDQKTKEYAEERHAAPGGSWNEQLSGTNAIGTAIATGAPIQVHSVEHFCESVKSWTCSAALIRDPIDRSIVGVLDISGLDKTFNAHSLALAICAANQVEAILKARATHDQIKLLQWCNEEASAWHNDGLIMLDKKGRAVSVNKYATESLNRFGIDIMPIKGEPLAGGRRFDLAGTSYPNWVRKEWIQPVSRNGKELGVLVVIPRHELRTAVPIDPSPIQKVQPEVGLAKGPLSSRIIGESESIQAASNKAIRLATGDFPVLIRGETGVGKEEFAIAIHNSSAISSGPFVAINCSVLAKDLVVSELFGYADGAFTGARRGGRVGKFEEADGGTLFLDEVGELPLDVQAQLLRVLQDGVLTRLGENRTRKVKVRILSATHCDLQANIGLGRFRGDLYYRLATTTLTIPPLRERPGDVGVLAAHFMDRLYEKYGKQKKVVSSKLIEVLNSYLWPGNVRELKGMLESMWHLTDNTVLIPEDLPAEYSHVYPEQTKSSFGGLARTEREAIVDAIAQNGRSIIMTARHLGIARSTLYQKLKKYGIEP